MATGPDGEYAGGLVASYPFMPGLRFILGLVWNRMICRVSPLGKPATWTLEDRPTLEEGYKKLAKKTVDKKEGMESLLQG